MSDNLLGVGIMGFCAAVVLLSRLALRWGWARWSTMLVLYVVVAGMGLAGLLFFVGAPKSGLRLPYVSAGVMSGGFVLQALLLVPASRRRLTRYCSIDPENVAHTTALVFGAGLLAVQAAVLGSDTPLGKLRPVGVSDVLLSEVPLLLLAAVGVGIFVQRSPRAAAVRLGLLRPHLWQLGLAMVVAGLYFWLASGMDAVDSIFDPVRHREVNGVSQQLFGSLAGSPLGILLLAGSAGVAEEILFRGAIQPRFGIIATSILFTSLHVQYALSPALAEVFLLSLGLGWLRRRANTSTAVAAHVTYDTLAALSIPAVGLVASAVGVVGILLLVAGRDRRRASERATAAARA